MRHNRFPQNGSFRIGLTFVVVALGYGSMRLGPVWSSNSDYESGWLIPILAVLLFLERCRDSPAPIAPAAGFKGDGHGTSLSDDPGALARSHSRCFPSGAWAAGCLAFRSSVSSCRPFITLGVNHGPIISLSRPASFLLEFLGLLGLRNR